MDHARAANTAVPGSTTGPMMGLMQEWPINLANILEHAAVAHPNVEVVTALVEGGRHRQTYAQTASRTRHLANALKALGAQPGDRIGTLAWNTHRHLEAWYAIAGQGAICHTINPRLFPEQIAYIINHAADRFLFIDLTFVPLWEGLKAHLPTVERVIVFSDRANMPAGDDYLCYEELIDGQSDVFDWPVLDEQTASSLCYTSGTTGEPKGVLYSHRSNMLQSLSIPHKDLLNLGATDASLMIVPMFHANAWGITYAGPMVGSKLVLPGKSMDGASIRQLIVEEGVTHAAAVPTVWKTLLGHLDATGEDIKPLREVVIGGAAVPRAMIEVLNDRYGVEVVHAWGMTEMSPLGSVNRPRRGEELLSAEARLDRRCKQGRPCFGVEMKIVDDNGVDQPRDGQSSGHLLVRGPWIVERYFGREDEQLLDANGWFDTGDIASIDPDGFMQITDRAKDLIKSGGEWISSVDLENAAMGCEWVEFACAIGVPHARWGERPILLVTAKEGSTTDVAGVRDELSKIIANWQMPDDIVVVDSLPMTATGKLDKKVLRAQYANHLDGRI